MGLFSLFGAKQAKDAPESVYFYTFHKTASTLFSGYVLKHVEGLQHVDYAKRIYDEGDLTDVKFKDRGCIYGAIRISATSWHARNGDDSYASVVDHRLIIPTTEPEFVRDKTAIFFVRDPRDILVSSYFSFGYSHVISSGSDDINETQQQTRENIQTKSLDEFVLETANSVKIKFDTMAALLDACERNVLLKYEDMIEDFDTVRDGLLQYLELGENVIHDMYKRTRPRHKEDKMNHRRSGRVGGFRDKLQQETVDALNEKLATVLERFDYQP